MPPHYHPLSDEEPTSIQALVDEYSDVDPEKRPEQLQADLVGVLMGIGEQTMDDSVKRNAVLTIIEALAHLDAERGVDSKIDFRPEEIDLHGQTFTINSPVLSSRKRDSE